MTAAGGPAALRGVRLWLAGLTALFWALTLWSVTHMDQPLVRLMMPMTASWTAAEALAVWLMWSVMMAAMMLPSSAPMVLAHRRLTAARGRPDEAGPFIAGYLVVWAGFSLAAALLQWWLQGLSVLSPMLVLKRDWLAGTILILAGVSQWTPLKQACLSRCRTPIGFLTTHWHAGRSGALRMGLTHGAYCVGCCWALMALLFVFGVMNLAAIGALTAMVAAEKLLPAGDRLARAGGVVLILWGTAIIAV